MSGIIRHVFLRLYDIIKLISCSFALLVFLFQGQILVDGAVVLEAAVEAKNGRLYILLDVLTPSSIRPVLPHRCDITENQIIKVS